MNEKKIYLLPHQRRFLESKAFYVSLTGGYGSGKSHSCAIKGIYQTWLDPDLLHAIVSPSFPQAKLSIIPSIFEILENVMGLQEGRDFDYNRQDHIFHLHKWGGKLVILSGENPKRLKGPNLASAGIDEPGIQSHDVFKQLIGRTREPKAKHRCIYMAGTPEDFNWYQEVVEGNLKPKDFDDIRAKSRDNIYLPEDFFTNMEESYSTEELISYMDGQFVNLSKAQAYHAFSNSNLIEQKEFTPDPGLPLLIGFDYNWFPNTAVIAQEVPDWKQFENSEPRKALIVFDEIWIRGSTELKCEEIIERYNAEKWKGQFQYRIYQDATGDKNTSVGISDLNLVQNSFRGLPHRIFYPAANPKRIDRLNSVNGRLRNSLGENFIFITKNCTHLIADLRKSSREEYLSSKYSDEERGHIGDCLGYLCHYRYPILRQTNFSLKRLSV